jgi:hypothetical protein
MAKKTNVTRENLAMKIMLLRDNQREKKMTFDEALKLAVRLIEKFERD